MLQYAQEKLCNLMMAHNYRLLTKPDNCIVDEINGCNQRISDS